MKMIMYDICFGESWSYIQKRYIMLNLTVHLHLITQLLYSVS